MKDPRAAHSAWLLLLFALFFSPTLGAAGLEPHPLLATTTTAGDGTWTGPLAGPAPSSRYAHTAIYDPVRDRMVVFGGLGSGQLKNDVWALSLTGSPAWSEIVPAGQPPTPRFHHTAIYDPVRDRMLVFGGWDTKPTNDVWALSLSGNPSWSRLLPSPGQGPEGRYQHTAIYDPVRDRMVVVGGSVGSYYEEDVWALDLAGSPAWQTLLPAPTSHWQHTAIYDPVRDRMVVFGGYSEAAETDETWQMSFAGGEAWTQLSPAPDPIMESPPVHRGGHVALYDPTGDQMLVFGGNTHYPFFYLNDVWTLTLAGNPAWRQLAPAGTAPPGRYGCAAIRRVDSMLLFGGELNGSVRDDAWTLSLAQPVSTPRDILPARVDLERPQPNPSRGEITLGFDLVQPGRVALDVFDSQGRHVTRVADAWFPAGRHTVTWKGDDARGNVVESGVYYVQMQAGTFRAARRTVRLR